MEKMAENSGLSVMEYISLGGALLKTLIAVFVAAITGFVRGPAQAPTYAQHVKYAGLRTATRSTTIRQLQALAPSTRRVYTDHAKQHGLPFAEANVSDGTFGFWLGDKSAKTVLFWLHGGGYVMTATTGHMKLVSNVINATQHRKSELAVFFLEYTMAPAAQYPQQLKQAAGALAYLLEHEGRSPSNVLLGGDSAGGNLALALLSHLSHPHPAVDPLNLNRNLRGAIILSPWVTFDQDSASMKANSQKDCLDLVALKTWSDAFIGNAKKDYYNHAKSAPSSWWEGLRADDMCLMAGRDEVFVDDIEELAATMKVQKPSLEVYVGQGEAHDPALMGYVLGSPDGPSERFFREWVLQRTDNKSTGL